MYPAEPFEAARPRMPRGTVAGVTWAASSGLTKYMRWRVVGVDQELALGVDATPSCWASNLSACSPPGASATPPRRL